MRCNSRGVSCVMSNSLPYTYSLKILEYEIWILLNDNKYSKKADKSFVSHVTVIVITCQNIFIAPSYMESFHSYCFTSQFFLFQITWLLPEKIHVYSRYLAYAWLFSMRIFGIFSCIKNTWTLHGYLLELLIIIFELLNKQLSAASYQYWQPSANDDM